MRPSTLLLAFLPALAIGTPTPEPPQAESDWPTLSSLLDTIDSTVLHGVLHQLSPKFKDGVFSEDRNAIEHVHSENHVMASKLVHMALKRQEANSTTTPSPAPAPVADPTVSEQLSQEITATTQPDPTTIQVAPEAPPNAAPVTTIEGAVVYSTQDGGVVTATSRNVAVSFTPSSSTRLVTSTLANGDVVTQTSVVVVNAPVTGSPDGDAAGAATTGDSPGLQDAAVSLGISGLVVMCAAAVGALVVLS